MSEENQAKLQADKKWSEVMQVAPLLCLSAPAGKENDGVNDGVDVSDVQGEEEPVAAQEEQRTEGTVMYRMEQADVPPPPKLPSVARPVEAAPPATAPKATARKPATARKAGGKSKDTQRKTPGSKKPRAGDKGPTGKALQVPHKPPHKKRYAVLASEDEHSGNDHSGDDEHAEQEEVMPTAKSTEQPKDTEQPKVSAATAHYTTRYTTRYTSHCTTCSELTANCVLSGDSSGLRGSRAA
jgi:hypothetical protein